MAILDRYILREYLLLFGLILASIVSLYLVIDFFGKIRMFMSNAATWSQVARHFLYLIPLIVSQTTPAVILLSTLITFGNLARHNEITALKSCGVSVYRLTVPVLAAGAVISVALFLFSELVTPSAYRRAEEIRLVEVQKQTLPGAFKQDRIWYRGAWGIYNFRLFDAAANAVNGVTINVLDRDFRLVRRIDAERAVWRDNRWEFVKVLIVNIPPEGFPVLERYERKVIDLPERPEDFRTVQKDADKMGFFELRSYIGKLRAEGYDATPYVVDLHGKVAGSLAGLILIVIGVCFPLRTERSGGLAQSIGAGIVLGFSYWLIFAFALSLGRAGTIPPLLSAWTANLLFAAGAVFLLRRVRT